MALDKFKILIIDNDLNTVMALEKLLTASNREVFTAYSGEEGLKIVKRENIGLVIADQVMPNMDGFELIEMLDANPKTRNIFTILITRKDQHFDDNIAYSLNHGAVDYLTKPVSLIIAKAKVKVFERMYYKRLHLEKRTKKINELLLNILPKTTADELRVRGRSQVRSYEKATVMFMDFVDFTRKAAHISPTTLVKRLDEYFVAFDEILLRHPVEKIKTIGDAYMCAAGIPIRNRTHAVDMVLAALELQNYMRTDAMQRELTNEEVWEVRIGIHTGPLVAGVVGRTKWSYDIWGHTVNTAARMETSAIPGTINISEDTHEEIAHYFDVKSRGAIHAKHLGAVEMFTLTGLKEKYRQAENLYLPNNDLIKELSAY